MTSTEDVAVQRWGTVRPFVVVRAAAVLAVAVLVGACGGGSDPEVAPPSGAATATTPVEPAPPVTPTPTPTATALSEFEDDPAVQAIRDYSRAQAEAVNGGGKNLKDLRKLTTDSRYEFMKGFVADEAKRLRYPGPNPFTPLAVRAVSATEKQVEICGIENGFAVDRATGKAPKQELVAARVDVVEEKGTWKVDRIAVVDTSCNGVSVPTETF